MKIEEKIQMIRLNVLRAEGFLKSAYEELNSLELESKKEED